MNFKKNKNHILWLVFIATILIVIIDVVLNFAQFEHLQFINWLTFLAPIVLLFLHATWTLSLKRGLFFIFLAATTGFIYEVIGVQNGTVFGGEYFYHPTHLGFLLFKVPILIGLFWAVFIYTGYTVTSSFLSWINIEKPTFKKQQFFILFLLILIDAVIIVAIDLFMDPLLVYAEFWTWVNGGAFFGIPIGNFVGWFYVCLIVTGIFRTIEFFAPQKKNTFNKETLLIPVIGYLALCLTFFVCALSIQFTALALVGLFAMLPIILINLVLFALRTRKLFFQ